MIIDKIKNEEQNNDVTTLLVVAIIKIRVQYFLWYEGGVVLRI